MFKVGDKVLHVRFGIGTIEDVSNLLVVKFPRFPGSSYFFEVDGRECPLDTLPMVIPIEEARRLNPDLSCLRKQKVRKEVVRYVRTYDFGPGCMLYNTPEEALEGVSEDARVIPIIIFYEVEE